MFRIVIASGFCGMLLAGSGSWYIQDLRWTRKEALRTAQIESEHARAISTLREKELSLQGRVDALAGLYDKQKEKYTRENSVLLDRVRSAEYRLRLPAVQSCPGPAAPEPAPGADAAGVCELSSGATQALFRIAERADRCSLKLNALQEYVRGLLKENPDGTLVE